MGNDCAIMARSPPGFLRREVVTKITRDRYAQCYSDFRTFIGKGAAIADDRALLDDRWWSTSNTSS